MTWNLFNSIAASSQCVRGCWMPYTWVSEVQLYFVSIPREKKKIYIHILLTIKGIYKGKLHKATELLPPIVKDFISKTW